MFVIENNFVLVRFFCYDYYVDLQLDLEKCYKFRN